MDHMCSARSFVFASLEKHDVVRGGVWQVSGKPRERLENWQESKNILGKTSKKSNLCWESRSFKKNGTNLKNARKRNNKIKTNQTNEKSETIKQS